MPSLPEIETIFHRALALPVSERREFVQSACAGDPELLREVESLLLHESGETEAFVAAVEPIAHDLLATRAALRNEFGPASMLGPYRIERTIGEGGMGAVFLATDTRLGRQVAIKVISGAIQLGHSSESRARFVREARAAAALSHPNIATLYDVGETNGTLWLVMEYVSGTSLRARLTGPLGESEWLRYASALTAAMEHAHNRRIIHRDLKPENILITADDQIRVIDFGLARAVSEQPGGSACLTAPSTFVGTMAYAAPELLAGGAGSARSDVYSLGVILYEMACGEHPFGGLTGHSLVTAILSGSYTPCAARNYRLSRGVAAVIDRCMSREPSRRYKDARELAESLRNIDAAALLQPEITPPTLAVMDFRNIGGAPELEWLGTGIAETLSADLTKVKSVRVASRSRVIQSLRRLGSPQDDPATAIELGRDLGARWIVTGGYQQIGDCVRVTTTLLDSGTGDALATEKIDGHWADIFEVQDRVVGALLKALTIGFGTTDQQRILPAETRNLAAWEHYIRGRQHMYAMEPGSLTAAIHHFERAVALDPEYAFAWSGMGTAHALLYISTTDLEDIGRASKYLERATELDPELGEPYPWLCNIRFRKDDMESALKAGRKAVELQPDLPEAHYFYGGLCCYMVPEYDPAFARTGCAHVAEAVRIDRRFHAGWLVLGGAATLLGKHAEAIQILQEAVRMESDTDVLYRFVGARTLLGFAYARSGLWENARALHTESAEVLRDTPHIYTSCFQTLSAIGLGDVELACGNGSAALTHYRRARRLITESRRIIGSVRLMLRVNAGLGAAYADIGEKARAAELTHQVEADLRDAPPPRPTATFECSLAQLWISLAVAQVRTGELDEAAASVARACELGWRDSQWLTISTIFEPLRSHPGFTASVDRIAAAPDLGFPMPPVSRRAAPENSAPVQATPARTATRE